MILSGFHQHGEQDPQEESKTVPLLTIPPPPPPAPQVKRTLRGGPLLFDNVSSRKVEGSGSCCPETIKLLMEPLEVRSGRM